MSNTARKQHAIIIGAGIGGIATANILAKAGYSVTVYEKNSQAGGRAGLLKQDGFTFDTGPSWYLMPDVFAHYFSLFGKDVNKELDLLRLSPAYKVFFEDQSQLRIYSDLARDSATFEDVEPGAGKALRSYVNEGERIYRLSMEHFLYSNFAAAGNFANRSVVRHGIKMAKRATTSLDRYVRSFVKDQKLRQILEYPAVFLGTSPFSAPALYSLMSALDFKEGVFYPRGGMYTIIERLLALSRELGVEYEYNSPVKCVITNGGKAAAIELQNGTQHSADIIISNADLHFTETQLLEPKDQTYPATYWKKQEAGPSALLCYLGVKGKLPELEHHNLFFADNWRGNFDAIYKTKSLPWPASFYVCKPSAHDTTVAPKNHENVFVLVPLPADISVAPNELEAMGNLYLSQIEQTTGITDFTSRIVSKSFFGPSDFSTTFNAWQGTALGPSHVLKQSAFFRTPNKSKKLSNFYYVGGFTTPGIGLPMCLISAELVYKRLVNDRTSKPITAITKLGDKR